MFVQVHTSSNAKPQRRVHTIQALHVHAYKFIKVHTSANQIDATHGAGAWQLGRVVEVKLRLAVVLLAAIEGLDAGNATVKDHNIHWSNSMTRKRVNKNLKKHSLHLIGKTNFQANNSLSTSKQ